MKEKRKKRVESYKTRYFCSPRMLSPENEGTEQRALKEKRKRMKERNSSPFSERMKRPERESKERKNERKKKKK